MAASSELLTLSRLRWNVPVMAELARAPEATFSRLAEALRVSRDSLSRSLRALAEPAWIARGKEAGTRAPYVLTRAGRRIAPSCVELVRTAQGLALEELAFRRWTLPVATALHGWSLRFAELRAMLPDITPRALALALKEMEAVGLLKREILGGFPPSASYRLTAKGQRFLPALDRLPAAP